ncbi:glycosyltransferase family 39 protein [Geomonas paludis]|uniref:Glycosyltransferase family 39 protein n=1 Tax=Geomonas paludis TaxID=2740185 RepID=A0A6V8MXI3_9BACT|nr:glycosyltransferase family 39 protein [Geomonas paludis]UPU34392.1 glycosyltransferase family 39 protein [Geomonas paludis]GFO64377.1 membrane protein [Geomonas paludis]
MRSWRDNTPARHAQLAVLLLFSAILAVYYPAMLSGIHMVDDPGIVSLYGTSPRLSLALLPGQGYYYRPILELTFWLDNFFWSMEPRVMHLENVLLHCANSLLVFLLGRKVLDQGSPSGGEGRGPFWGALLAASFFALHPVNVEAVAWLAGRSDPLLSLFVLSACWFWLNWLTQPSWRDLVAALLLFSAALLTKETALAAGGVAALLALVWRGGATVRQRAGALGLVAVPALVLVIFALAIRSGTSGLSRFIATGGLDAGKAVGDALAACGFYFKKLVLPLPLNFAITAVDPCYAVAGAVVVAAISLLFLRRRLTAALFASALLVLLPAVLVAVRQVAWTPIAERYLYLPSAFFALGIASLATERLKPLRTVLVAVLVPLLLFFAVASLQRTLLWRDKIAFCQDAISKSPGFGTLYNDLGVVLLQQKRFDQAAKAFAIADRLNQRESMRMLIKANLMSVAFTQEDYLGVRRQFFRLFKEKKEAGAEFLELLQRADGRRLPALHGAVKVALARDILETLDLLNQKRYDPYWLYRSGQLSLEIGDKARALDYFNRAYRAAPPDAHYVKSTELYLRKLRKQ